MCAYINIYTRMYGLFFVCYVCTNHKSPGDLSMRGIELAANLPSKDWRLPVLRIENPESHETTTPTSETGK